MELFSRHLINPKMKKIPFDANEKEPKNIKIRNGDIFEDKFDNNFNGN